jgi:hypothetical protein
MRTTLVIEDSLYRRVKAKAGMEGKTVTELVEIGLRQVVDSSFSFNPQTTPAIPSWISVVQTASDSSGWKEEIAGIDREIDEAFGKIEPDEVI